MHTPERIIQMGMGFWPARTLQAAVKFDLFTVLAGKGMTGEQLRGALDLAPRANPDFFDALVALGLLDRKGDGPEAVYSNSGEAAAFLDKASPTYVGGFMEMSHDRLYPFWTDLGVALKTGKAQNETKHGGAPMFDQVYADPDRLEQFMSAMSSVTGGNALAFAAKFDFAPYSTLCDVGGASGVLSMAVARAHPHMNCTSADLAVVEPIAKKKIAAAGLSDRIATKVIDFLNGPLPQADVITMGLILHDWNLETKKMLVAKAYEALPAGGVFVVIEHLIDDARRENAFGLMMSLNMLIEYGDAFDYTGADFNDWCLEAGFSRSEVLHLLGPCSAAIAYK
ncbi:MAG: methyltransferase [Caulobacteraceae bacterium]